MRIHGYVVSILFRVKRATIVCLRTSCSLYLSTLLPPLKRKHAREMESYVRLFLAKRRKYAEVDKQTAAAALLALLEDGNGTLFSEPCTGRYCSNVLSMPDIDSLEARCMDLEKQNEHYQRRC